MDQQVEPYYNYTLRGRDKDWDIELAQGNKMLGSDKESMPLLKHSPSSHNSASSEEPRFSFRTLQPSDRQVIQALHEEWFPVSYEDEFYDELVKNRMFNSGDKLFSCVALYPSQEEKQQLSEPRGSSVVYDIENYPDGVFCQHVVNEETHRTTSTTSTGDSIVACIVGSFVDASRVNKHTREVLLGKQRHSKLFYIMTLGTVTNFRHYGLATKLVTKCMDLVQDDPSCGALYLHVITFNHAAIRFYEKLGFYRVEEVQDYYAIDGKHYNCYLYAKYFHGNGGHRSLFNFVSRLWSVVWDRVLSPVSLLQELVGRFDDRDYRGSYLAN